MSEIIEENKKESKGKDSRIKYALINGVLIGLLLWSIYNDTVRNIVFWVYLVMMSAMVIFAVIALKEMKVGARLLFNLSLQTIIIGLIIYGLFTPEQGSKVAVLLLFLHVFQSVQAFLMKTFKPERRTEERLGAMHRRD